MIGSEERCNKYKKVIFVQRTNTQTNNDAIQIIQWLVFPNIYIISSQKAHEEEGDTITPII